MKKKTLKIVFRSFKLTVKETTTQDIHRSEDATDTIGHTSIVLSCRLISTIHVTATSYSVKCSNQYWPLSECVSGVTCFTS